jgi:hypothetical protein
MITKGKSGVYVIVCCHTVKLLRELIVATDFADLPIDDFNKHRVSEIIAELLMATIENDVEFDSMYVTFVDEILDYLSNFVHVVGIRSISCWYDDTLLIHCSPIGVKDGTRSKD